MERKHSNFFWPSYVDLMTSLFAVALVLFVVSYFALNKKKNEIEAEKNKLESMVNAMKIVKNMAQEYFVYDDVYKRFMLKEDVKFPVNVYKIPEDEKLRMVTIGEKIAEMINVLKSDDALRGTNVRFLVLVEGMASNLPGDNNYENYILSYKRALELVNLWRTYIKDFQNNQIELQIAGSGTDGVGRYNTPYDYKNLEEEKKNQRFLIQLILKGDDLSVPQKEN